MGNMKEETEKRKYKLILVAGARPNFMKIAPIVGALRKHRVQPATQSPSAASSGPNGYAGPGRTPQLNRT